MTRLRKAVSEANAPVSAGLGFDQYELNLADIRLGRELGSGQFGVVREGIYTNGTKVRSMLAAVPTEREAVLEGVPLRASWGINGHEPLLSVNANITVKNAVCWRRRLSHTAFEP